MRKSGLIIGGSSGMGLALTAELLRRGYTSLTVADRVPIDEAALPLQLREAFQKTVTQRQVNLVSGELQWLDELPQVDTLIYTAGFGRVADFPSLTPAEVENIIQVNAAMAIRVLHHYAQRLYSREDFYCAVLGSIAGHLASPAFSVYGAAKSALCRLVESINTELEAGSYVNRVLDVSPGSLKGTRFTGGRNRLDALGELPAQIVEQMLQRQCLFIPELDTVYGRVLNRYREDAHAFGLESYAYKKDANRFSSKPQVLIGYLSGTFDLFHIGHLNLLRRAKQCCDYLVVGVHESGSWKGKETFIPFEERMEIVRSVRYVDEVIPSMTEDSDAWQKVGFHLLFVGSDYKGTPRFERYERFFADKGVRIVYFPYTKETSSTQLRELVSRQLKK